MAASLPLVPIVCSDMIVFIVTDFGQLGVSPVSASMHVPTLVDTSMMDAAIVQLAMQRDHAVVLTQNGKVYATGRVCIVNIFLYIFFKNNFNQLGLGASSYSVSFTSTFQQITLSGSISTPIVRIYATLENTFFLTNDNRLFGLGGMQKLGLPVQYSSLTAVSVGATKLDRVYAGFHISYGWELKTGYEKNPTYLYYLDKLMAGEEMTINILETIPRTEHCLSCNLA